MAAIFLKLLNMSITASWLVLAVIVLRLLLKKAPKAITCALWGLVAIRLLCPFSMESVLSLIPSAETVPQEIVYAKEPVINSGVPIINQVVNPVITDTFAPPDTLTSVNPIQVFLAVAANLWILGMICMAVYVLVSYLRLRKKVSEAVEIDRNIYLCDHVDTPFILGIFRPRIYLPSTIAEKDMEYVLAHERAHLCRRDHFWKPLGFALLTVYWFNPILWVAYILLCRDIELACDERVIRDMGVEDKKAYTSALLNCSVPRKMIVACPLAFGEVGVKRRIKSALNYKKPAFWIIIVAVLASIAVAVGFLTDPKKEEEELPKIHAHSYRVEEVVYGAPHESLLMIAGENTPFFSITDDLGLLRKEEANTNDGWTYLGYLEEFELTSENFDALFMGPRWTIDTSLRSFCANTANAWRLVNSDALYYVLQQKDGSVYLAHGHSQQSFSWVFKLATDVAENTGWIAIASGEAVPLILSDAPIEEVKDLVYWLDITDKFFSIYYDGIGRTGWYSLYDAETLEPVEVFHTSGVPQEWGVFSYAEDEHDYIVCLQGNPGENLYFGATYHELSTSLSISCETAVAYAGYIRNEAIFTDALNSDKMDDGEVKHLPIRKFDSVKELDMFKTDFADDISKRAWDEVPSFAAVSEQYDADFFEEHTLFVVYVEASSGSCRYAVGSVELDFQDNVSFTIHAEITRSPETDDMAGWFLCVAVDKQYAEYCSTFDADLNAVSNAHALLGKWSTFATNIGIADEDTPPYSEWSYTFFSDGTGVHTVGEDASDFTYTTEGRLLRMRFPRDNGMENVKTFVYTVDGDTLTLADELSADRLGTLTKVPVDTASLDMIEQPSGNLTVRFFGEQNLPDEPKEIDSFSYRLEKQGDYYLSVLGNTFYLDNGELCNTESGEFVFSFSIYQDALPYVGPLYKVLNSIVTADYEGNGFDALALANEHVTITLNGETVTLSEVRLGAGNGHRDFYFTFTADAAVDMREIQSFSIEIQ